MLEKSIHKLYRFVHAIVVADGKTQFIFKFVNTKLSWDYSVLVKVSINFVSCFLGMRWKADQKEVGLAGLYLKVDVLK